MSEKTVAEKAHVKPDARIALVDPAPGVVESLGLPPTVVFVGPAEASLVFLFVRDRSQLEARMPAVVEALPAEAALWVFFRKGARGQGLDMSRNDVWSIAEKADMRPLGLVSIDETWTAFRLKQSD